MRSAGVLAYCVGLALLVSGCDPNDRDYFHRGIGTELYTADTASATDLQNIYLDYLCRQSEPFVGAEVPSCAQRVVSANAWPLIVQAGMNDIDARCDSYLAWLDQKKRENVGILAELGAVRFAVDALANPVVTGVSPVGLAAIAAAFALANSTVSNFNALLLQVDHTTVQSVVFVNRRIFRESVLGLTIANKPMAIHALRSYLTICMPMTIAANINSTVTVFQQAGPDAIDKQQLVGTTTIGTPLQAQQTITEPHRTFVPVTPDFGQFFQESLSQSEAERVLNALCLNKNAPSGTDNKTIVTLAKALVRIYQVDENSPDSRITGRDRETIMKQTDCGAARNYFERKVFANTTTDQARTISVSAVKSLVTFLNRSDAGGQLDPAASLANARAKIKSVRIDPTIAKQLTIPIPAQLENQMTPDLFAALRQLPPR